MSAGKTRLCKVLLYVAMWCAAISYLCGVLLGDPSMMVWAFFGFVMTLLLVGVIEAKP